jgi:ribosomal protein S18 acetylase RimI-like enzyme
MGLERILCFERLLFPEHPLLDPEFWRQDSIHVHAIEANGTMVGYLAVELDAEPGDTEDSDSVHAEGSIYVITIGIVPEMRRKGIGYAARLWMGHRAPFLQDGKRIISTVRTSNLAAQRMNQKVGSTLLGPSPTFYADGEDALVYEFVIPH